MLFSRCHLYPLSGFKSFSLILSWLDWFRVSTPVNELQVSEGKNRTNSYLSCFDSDFGLQNNKLGSPISISENKEWLTAEDGWYSCSCAFKEMGILPLYSQYLYSPIMFVAKNRDLFYANTDVHTFGTRYRNDLHLSSARLKVFQRGTFYSRIRAYNNLPKNIKDLSHNVKHFKRVLKAFFQTHSFYWLEEYFDPKLNWNSMLQ